MQQRIENRLEAVQKQSLRLSHYADIILKMLSMNAAQLNDYLRREADRNPCVELVFPQATGAYLDELPAPEDADYRHDLLLQLPRNGEPQTLQLARALIKQLDENGFLPFDPIRPAKEPLRTALKAALHLVQSLEPAGVGARSLRECYYIQAMRQTPENEDIRLLLRKAELYARYKRGELCELCDVLGWSRRRLDAVTEVLKTYRMRPVEPMGGQIQHIIPDAEIIRGADGRLTVRLMEHALPHVSLSGSYVDSLQAGGTKFANEGIFYANRLIYCLEHRNATLLSVLQYAVERQTAFLTGGIRVRLPMKSAAEALGVNRSTVSRALTGKYIRFEGRTFLAAELFSRAGKGDVSMEYACSLIQALIGQNDSEKALSDRELSDRLKAQYGVCLSRRTVNKYRLEQGISHEPERRML